MLSKLEKIQALDDETLGEQMTRHLVLALVEDAGKNRLQFAGKSFRTGLVMKVLAPLSTHPKHKHPPAKRTKGCYRTDSPYHAPVLCRSIICYRCDILRPYSAAISFAHLGRRWQKNDTDRLRSSMNQSLPFA